jgi:hypothetical protein
MSQIQDKDIYLKAKNIVYQQYSKPSAYRSGALVKKYKELGGRYSGEKQKIGLVRWFKEKWEDVGGLEYPVYRPTIRISKETPLLASEIDEKDLKKKIKEKQKIKGEKNLKPFKKK